MQAQQLIALRAQKDRFFQHHEQSPLTEEQKAKFNGLSYYPPQPHLDLTVTVQPFDQKTDVQIQTTSGEPRWYRRYGEFHFTVSSQQARLTIYQTPHGFFLPFVDAGAGAETYPAGRYLEPVQLEDGRFRVDFNQAYNPFCAYNPMWNCPLTPPENHLDVYIRAGEKIPTGDWVIK